MRGKISIDAVATIIALFLAVCVIIYSSGRRAATIDHTLEEIKNNTEKLSQTPLILQEIKKNTDKLPEMAVHTKAMFERSMSAIILSEMGKEANPHDLPVCIKLLPEELRNEIDRLIKENPDKSEDDLTAILVRELDFSFILKISEERKVSFDKCLKNLGSYAKNKKVAFSKSQ